MKKEIIVFLADGFEEIEGLTVVDLLRRAGADVRTVSVSGKEMVDGAHGIRVSADEIFVEGNYGQADMVVLPGGMPGTLNLKAHEGVRRTVEDTLGRGAYIAAICAAPTVFADMGLLNGKRAVCYPGMEDELTGAVCQSGAVVEDGSIITSRGLGTAIDFALALTAKLYGREKAEEIKRSIVYCQS